MIDVFPLVDFVALPEQSTESSVDAYVSRLVDLVELSRLGLIRFLPSVSSIGILMSSGVYPFVSEIKRVLSESGSRAYSVEDINRVLNYIVGSTESMESVTGIVDVLASHANIDPACSWINDALVSDAVRSLLSIAVWKQSTGNSNHVVGVSVSELAAFNVRATISIIEDQLRRSCPFAVHQELAAAASFGAMLARIDATTLFQRAPTPEAAVLSFRIAVLQTLYVEDPTVRLHDVPYFTFHPNFLDTVHSHGFRTERTKTNRLLRSMEDVLLDRNRSDGHAIRISSGGGSPQLRRQNDLAWRFDIDYEFHLHLWRCDDGPEYVCVVTHNDFGISV